MRFQNFIMFAKKHGLQASTPDDYNRQKFSRPRGYGLHQVRASRQKLGYTGWFDIPPNPTPGVTITDHNGNLRKCWVYIDKSGQEHRFPLTKCGHVWVKNAVDKNLFKEVLDALEHEL